MGKIHATRQEIVTMHDLLREHLKPDPTADVREKIFIYDQDWDDDRIARLVAGRINGGHVARLRNELFGQIRRPVSDEISAVRAELVDVKATVTELTKNLAALWDLHSKLCLSLSVNKVIDARHLVGQKALAQAVGEAA